MRDVRSAWHSPLPPSGARPDAAIEAREERNEEIRDGSDSYNKIIIIVNTFINL